MLVGVRNSQVSGLTLAPRQDHHRGDGGTVRQGHPAACV